jgi:hypothetical protein
VDLDLLRHNFSEYFIAVIVTDLCATELPYNVGRPESRSMSDLAASSVYVCSKLLAVFFQVGDFAGGQRPAGATGASESIPSPRRRPKTTLK